MPNTQTAETILTYIAEKHSCTKEEARSGSIDMRTLVQAQGERARFERKRFTAREVLQMRTAALRAIFDLSDDGIDWTMQRCQRIVDAHAEYTAWCDSHL